MLYCVSHWTRDAPTTTTRGQSCAKPTMLGINAISQRNALPQSLINYANSFESTFRLDYHYLSASQRHFINSRTSAKSLASLACERLCSCARHNPHPAARPLPPAPPLHVDPRDPMKAKVRSRQVHASSANFGCEFSHQRRHQLPTPAPNTSSQHPHSACFPHARRTFRRNAPVCPMFLRVHSGHKHTYARTPVVFHPNGCTKCTPAGVSMAKCADQQRSAT